MCDEGAARTVRKLFDLFQLLMTRKLFDIIEQNNPSGIIIEKQKRSEVYSVTADNINAPFYISDLIIYYNYITSTLIKIDINGYA